MTPRGAPPRIEKSIRKSTKRALNSLWVDDCKAAPEGCAVAHTYDDALRMLRKYRYEVLYLDFDLGERRTGLDLLRQARAENRLPAKVECISWNPVGRRQILDELKAPRPPCAGPARAYLP